MTKTKKKHNTEIKTTTNFNLLLFPKMENLLDLMMSHLFLLSEIKTSQLEVPESKVSAGRGKNRIKISCARMKGQARSWQVRRSASLEGAASASLSPACRSSCSHNLYASTRIPMHYLKRVA